MTILTRVLVVALLFCCSAQVVVAQEDSTQVALTDADWSKYAQIEVMTSTFLTQKQKS